MHWSPRRAKVGQVTSSKGLRSLLTSRHPQAELFDDEHLGQPCPRTAQPGNRLSRNDLRDGQFHGHASDVVDRFFAWGAWRTDKQLFMKYLARYHEYLRAKLKCCRALKLPTMPPLSMHTKHGVVCRRDDGVLDTMVPPTCSAEMVAFWRIPN